MSYDIELVDPLTKEVLTLDKPHSFKGGTYIEGGTNQYWLNITYNYAEQFYKVFGEKGIRIIYGMSAAQSLPILEEAIIKLKNDISDDYWQSTEGNAKIALLQLYAFAQARLEGIWQGD